MAGGAPRTWGAEATQTPSRIEVTGDAGVNADVDNRPLDEALRTMAAKGLFEIRGAVPPGVTVTVHFSHLTLDEALKKLMRGYNYVLVDQGPSRAPLLMLMGKIERGGPAQQAVAGAPPVPPAPEQPPAVAPAPSPRRPPPGLPTNLSPPVGAQAVQAAQPGPVLPPGEIGSPPIQAGEGSPGAVAMRPGAPQGEGQPPQPPAQPQTEPERSTGFSF